MSKPVYLTAEALERLKKELQTARTTGRADIAEAIAEARAQGDLSENAEYDAAKEAQGHLEARIAKLEDTMANARVVDESSVDTSRARILSKVTVRKKGDKREMSYILVSAEEADIKQQKISVDSPIGKALLAKEIGDVVRVKVPAGAIELEILDITR